MKVLKTVLSTIFYLTLSLQGFSQANGLIGVKGGWLQSSIIGSDANSQEVKSGFNAGLVFQVASSNHLIALQPEVLYSRKGTELTYLNIKEEYEIQYIEVPLLLKLALPLETIRPNVFLGPYAGFKLEDKYTYTELFSGLSTSDTNQLKGVDYGAVFGAGLDIDLNPVILTLDGRYNLGFQDLEKVETAEDIKNGSFSINIGVLFYL